MNKPVFTEIKRTDGTTLVFSDDSEGRYIALFDQEGHNLQHINLSNDEALQLREWTNEVTEEMFTYDDLMRLLDEYPTFSEPTRQRLLRTAWKNLYSKAREKGYGIYCGYHGEVRDFCLTGHVDGFPHTFTASYEGVLRGVYWLEQQGVAVWHQEEDSLDGILKNMEGWSDPDQLSWCEYSVEDEAQEYDETQEAYELFEDF